MSCAGSFAGARVQAIFDTAAQDNFVSHSYAVRIGLTVTANDDKMATAANGTRVAVTGMASGRLRLPGHTSTVHCRVANLGADFELILGEPWLQRHKVALHNGTRTADIESGTSKRLTIQCGSLAGDVLTADCTESAWCGAPCCTELH